MHSSSSFTNLIVFQTVISMAVRLVSELIDAGELRSKRLDIYVFGIIDINLEEDGGLVGSSVCCIC